MRYLSEKETDEACLLIKNGELVGIPTETVYGLGANGLNPSAVEKIFVAKGRPQDNPLILHLGESEWMARYCVEIPSVAWVLAERFWPGPLTLILKRNELVPNCVTAGLDTVGVRCPDHPVCREILRKVDLPIAAPSGNTSGKPSPTSPRRMGEDMEGKISAIVDGGACTVGVESTILDLTQNPPCILRVGGVTREELETVLSLREDGSCSSEEAPKAPGMKYRHYAPNAAMTLVVGEYEGSSLYIKERLSKGDGVLCFEECASRFSGGYVVSIGKENHFTEQGRTVFEGLRSFDDTDVSRIWAQCPREEGIGAAVCNRLRKAAETVVFVNKKGEMI
ncbi:MAG: L-threonylcarbamoyladenylate synthase [Eubacteriales bacterium]